MWSIWWRGRTLSRGCQWMAGEIRSGTRRLQSLKGGKSLLDSMSSTVSCNIFLSRVWSALLLISEVILVHQEKLARDRKRLAARYPLENRFVRYGNECERMRLTEVPFPFPFPWGNNSVLGNVSWFYSVHVLVCWAGSRKTGLIFRFPKSVLRILKVLCQVYNTL